MKLFVSILKATFFLIFVIGLLPLIPNLPPNFKFSSFTAPDPPALEGKLALNTLLNGAERMFEGDIIGPECFTVLNGELYTTLHGGFVAKIVGNKIQPVVKFGVPCEDRSEEAKCGRPLGIFAGPDNVLYIADAYYGVFTYNVNSGKKNKLFGPEDVVAGRKPKLFNSLTLSSDGFLYWTDSTSDVHLQDGLYSLLADGTGRLIKYDPRSKEHTVLIDGLLFANGVALAPDESFVIVAETGTGRIHRYWLKGPLSGKTDIFADQLPGFPDNLRAGSKGFLVSIVLAADVDTPMLAHALYPLPYIRKALSRFLALIELTLHKIDSYYPNTFCKKGTYFIGHFEMSKLFNPPRVTLVVFDVEGNVIDTFHALDGSVTSISDAIVHRGEIFLGSPYNSYLGRVNNPEVVARFQKAFPTPLKVSIRAKETTTASPAKPPTTTTTTPKPITTRTPKPTTTTTPKPTTKPATTAAPKPTTTTTTPKPTTTTTTPKPTTTTPKPAATVTSTPVTTTGRQPEAIPRQVPTTSRPATAKPAGKPVKPQSRDANEL